MRFLFKFSLRMELIIFTYLYKMGCILLPHAVSITASTLNPSIQLQLAVTIPHISKYLPGTWKPVHFPSKTISNM